MKFILLAMLIDSAIVEGSRGSRGVGIGASFQMMEFVTEKGCQAAAREIKAFESKIKTKCILTYK